MMMSDTMRDTPCRNCYRWLARLSPSGNGVMFCDAGCAYQYDRKHRTSYAFDQYHYIGVGDSVRFATTDLDQAWASLHHWLRTFDHRPTLEQVKEAYIPQMYGMPGYIHFARTR
jgi:hypothetical protein